MSSFRRRATYRRLSVAIAICMLVGVSTGGRASSSRVKAATGYLRTEGNKIVDASGTTVGLSGLNWFGLETANNAPHGLWSRSWQAMLDQIKSLGYNTIRLPFSNAALDPGAQPTGIDYTKNPDLQGLSPLEVMDQIVAGARQRGIWVILDNHRSTPGGGPEADGLWYTADYPESRWIDDWKMLAARYKGNPAVIGVDLRNEPHGEACWGCGDRARDWRLAAERAGNAILGVNPNLLIIVEGISAYNGQSYWWGGNLMGAKEHPVRLDVPDRLVYSLHDYPESVAYQSWFGEPGFPSNLPAVWDRYWGYLVDDGTAPLLIGEFGTRLGTAKDRQWLQALQSYIGRKGLSWTFWSLNPDSGDTGGLLLDDWQSVNREKQDLLAKIQYPFGESPAAPPPATQPAPATQRASPTSSPQPAPAAIQPRGTVLLPMALNHSGGASLDSWSTFSDPKSKLHASLGSSERGKSLQVDYSLSPGGWGGVEQKFSAPKDWGGYRELAFSFYGGHTGNRIRVELLDGRSPGSSGDTSERFEFIFTDDFDGWKDLELPWSYFQRRTDWQPSGAPDDGLGLKAIWGINFAPLEGQGSFQVEGVRLSK